MLKYMKVDDVIDASPVHYFCGIWGVIATGLFASDDLLGGAHEAGLFYGGGLLLGWQLAGVLVITVWTAGVTAAFMYPLKLCGQLRISEEEEQLGLDEIMRRNQYATVTTPTYGARKLNKDVKLSKDVDAAPPMDLSSGTTVHLEIADAEAALPPFSP